MGLVKALALLLRAWFIPRTDLVVENLALRQQLAVLNRPGKRPQLCPRDRVFWAWLMRLWPGWRSALVIVKPDTVVHWHRQGFRLYWRWKSKGGKTGRPATSAQVRKLIRQMCTENPTWGAPRIQSELRLLGHKLAESTVAKYIVRGRRPPSQTWRTFLKNHLGELASVDFFTVPTATFRVLYCFVVLRHEQRRVVQFNVTQHPTAAWTAQQVVEAFPYDETPRYLLRDRDSIYGDAFRRRIKSLTIEEVVSAPRSPWQSPYVERLVGPIRRDCLDHVIVLGERHLTRILTEYFDYYHQARTHLSLERNAPTPREVEPVNRGEVVAIPLVGGLHHRYTRVAA